MDGMPPPGSTPGETLLELSRLARQAEDRTELDFVAANSTHALAPYRQAALWFAEGGVRTLSGVVQVEANAPYVQWLDQLCRHLQAEGEIVRGRLPDELAQQWDEWLPEHAWWLPLHWDDGTPGGVRGGLLLARDLPWMAHEAPLLAEWRDILAHAYRAQSRSGGELGAALRRTFKRLVGGGRSDGPWYRRRRIQAALAVCAVLLFPVRLTVLAPGELVPLDPASVRSPLEGVIDRFFVAPNQTVKQGDPLFEYDQAELQGKAAVAAQALATAEAEYRQAVQQTLMDNKNKSALAALQGRIEERRAESDFLRGQAERARVLAPRAGMALFDDPSEWVGRPVAVGERVMRIATLGEVEVEAWLGVADAIPFEQGAPARLYLASSPLDPVAAHIRYVAYEAVPRPDGGYAFRVRATLDGKTGYRPGLKGTVKLSGGRVPLVYWALRRPLAALRQLVGW
ncbi:MAG TPA: HlyD family efflux transporter periplasmic adaptor subunit [Telluria sp.]|nr:HlyD family efflux transporter periplasmic adaptor subunit [Telluria sp.]